MAPGAGEVVRPRQRIARDDAADVIDHRRQTAVKEMLRAGRWSEPSEPLSHSLRTLETTLLPELSADGAVLGIDSLTHDTTRVKDIEKNG
jgi:hypothetical protein